MNGDNTKYRSADGSPLTPNEIARLDEIEVRLGDSEEIPETSDEAWATAERGKHVRPTAQAISVRLDPDVMAWLRAKGCGYSTEINRILREKMLNEV
jgi:uncharacterized protein (DUF4415 family)